MDKISDYNTQRVRAVFVATGASIAAVSLGHLTQKLNCLKDAGYIQAACFGYIAKDISIYAMLKFEKKIENETKRAIFSNILGASFAITVCHIASFIRVNDSPITSFAAIILTIVSIAMAFIFPHNLYFLPNGNTFTGQLKRGKPSGYGVVRDWGRVIFEGDYLLDRGRHGFGKQFISNVKVYEGSWQKDQRHGQGKQFTSSGKLLFDGEFYNGKIAFGNMFDESGDKVIYTGRFVNDLPDGHGGLFSPTGKLLFEGAFQGGRKVFGSIFDEKGVHVVYRGPFVNDMIPGIDKT